MVNYKTLLLILTVPLLLYSCSTNSTNSIPKTNDDILSSLNWSNISLKDTIVFSISSDLNGNYYSFTGLEVFVSQSDLSSNKELVILRDRNGFISNGNSNWVVSISDSSILYSQTNSVSFEEKIYPQSVITSALLDEQELYLSTDKEQLLVQNLSTLAVDTLYQNISNQEVRLISKIEDDLFLRVGSEIFKQDLGGNSISFQSTDLPANQTTKIISSSNLNTLFAASTRSKVLRSKDKGETWQSVWPEQLVVNPVTDIHYSNNGVLFVSILGSGIFYSENDGDKWYSLTNNELDWNTKSFQIINDKIFAGTYSGIYQSSPISILE